MPDIRKETDGLGVVEVPADKPLCAQIQRAVELTARRTVEKCVMWLVRLALRRPYTFGSRYAKEVT
jgi:fumarate hydratase class II